MGLYHATLWFRLFLVTCACRSLSCCMDARHGTLACMERDTHARLTAFPSRRLLNCDRDAALFVVDELERQCERCLYFTGERGKTTALMLKSEDHQAKWKKERGERLQKRGESNMSRKIGSRNAFSLLVPCGRATERIGGMLRLRGGLEVFWRPASLIKTKEWLEATTLDGSPVESRFESNWDAGNSTLETRLHMAAELGDGAAIARLVEGGVDVDCQNLARQTPLMKAAMQAHESVWCLSTLLQYGANVLHRNILNETALDNAKEAYEECQGPKEAVELLQRATDIALAEGPGDDNMEESTILVPDARDDAGAGFLQAAADARLPPSPEEYFHVRAIAQSQLRIATEKEEDKRQKESKEVEAEGKGKGKNKKKYKNVRERFKRLKQKRKDKKSQGGGGVGKA